MMGLAAGKQSTRGHVHDHGQGGDEHREGQQQPRLVARRLGRGVTLAKHRLGPAFPLVERDGDLGAGEVNGCVFPVPPTANVHARIPGADVQGAVVAAANLIDDVQPEAARWVAGKVLLQGVDDGRAVRPIRRVVAHGQALFDPDPEVPHPDDHVLFSHPRIQVALGRQVAPILAVVDFFILKV